MDILAILLKSLDFGWRNLFFNPFGRFLTNQILILQKCNADLRDKM